MPPACWALAPCVDIPENRATAQIARRICRMVAPYATFQLTYDQLTGSGSLMSINHLGDL